MQPFNVPGHAHQVPFALYRFKAPQHEPVKAHNRLDDAKDRLYRAFAGGVYRSACYGLEPMLHPGDDVGSIGQRWRLTKTL